MSTITRDHPIAKSVLAVSPAAVRVYADETRAEYGDLWLDPRSFDDTHGNPIRVNWPDTASGADDLEAIVEAFRESWSTSDPGPWTRLGGSCWFLDIAKED